MSTHPTGMLGQQSEGDWALVSAGTIRMTPTSHAIEIMEIVSRKTGQRLLVVQDCYSGVMTVSPAPEPSGNFGVDDPPPPEPSAAELGYIHQDDSDPGWDALRSDLGGQEYP